uniref:Uncharacterized protein n=1 Tax=Anguilla anguilla TaxID=7936 RepID=A0A0E9UEJ2_ANGAN
MYLLYELTGHLFFL